MSFNKNMIAKTNDQKTLLFNQFGSTKIVLTARRFIVVTLRIISGGKLFLGRVELFTFKCENNVDLST